MSDIASLLPCPIDIRERSSRIVSRLTGRAARKYGFPLFHRQETGRLLEGYTVHLMARHFRLKPQLSQTTWGMEIADLDRACTVARKKLFAAKRSAASLGL